MNYHLGIRIGLKSVACSQHLAAQLIMVFDYPVMDKRDPPRAIGMGMGIALSDSAMSRPPGMAETRGALGHRDLRLPNFAHLLLGQDTSIVTHRDSPGVVAQVLQATETVQNHVGRVRLAAGIRKDAAHSNASI